MLGGVLGDPSGYGHRMYLIFIIALSLNHEINLKKWIVVYTEQLCDCTDLETQMASCLRKRTGIPKLQRLELVL